MPLMRRSTLAGAVLLLGFAGVAAAKVPADWTAEWPQTDFSRHTVPLAEIASGGPPKDGIPAVDEPRFTPVSQASIADRAPVIALQLGGEARAYPLAVITWHEIVNDTVAGVPVTVTYCPLCNAAIAFDRRVDGEVLDFGTTGKLRNSDLVMYDRQSESWWQQFTGEAIVGAKAGTVLDMIPVRLVPFKEFAAAHPDGAVLVPNDPSLRPYGSNPYLGYESAGVPFLYGGDMPEGVIPMERVVVVDGKAWTLSKLREEGRIEAGELVLSWQPGQATALDARTIAEGFDVGTVRVARSEGGGMVDVVHHVTFAFVYHAFHPDGVIFGAE